LDDRFNENFMAESQQPDQFAALAQDFIDLIDAGELSPAELNA
jgi:hypothetical protein